MVVDGGKMQQAQASRQASKRQMQGHAQNNGRTDTVFVEKQKIQKERKGNKREETCWFFVIVTRRSGRDVWEEKVGPYKLMYGSQALVCTCNWTCAMEVSL